MPRAIGQNLGIVEDMEVANEDLCRSMLRGEVAAELYEFVERSSTGSRGRLSSRAGVNSPLRCHGRERALR